MQIYQAQRAFRDKNKKWAAKVDELALPEEAGLPQHTMDLRATSDGYEASITFTPAGGKPQTWTIRQDSADSTACGRVG